MPRPASQAPEVTHRLGSREQSGGLRVPAAQLPLLPIRQQSFPSTLGWHRIWRGKEEGLRKDEGEDRKEGKVPGGRKDGNARLEVQAGLERVLGDCCPQACWTICVHSTALAPYHHATTEAAGNGSTPYIFIHSTPQVRPGQIIRWAGVGDSLWRKELNTKKVAQSHALGPETVLANYRHKSLA